MASLLSFFRRRPTTIRKRGCDKFSLERLEERLALAANLLSISDAWVEEGHSGTSLAVFAVSLNQASTEAVTVEYHTIGTGAEGGVDYESVWNMLTFDPGQTSKTISVQVYGDTDVETNELFYVLLENSTGATLSDDNYGQGMIGNDDSTTPNDPPIAADDVYEVAEDYSLSAYGFGVLSNDFDPELGNLQAVLVSGPEHGWLYLDSGGSFSYYPDENYYGPDSFTYRAVDDAGLGDFATVSITVWGMDDPIDLTAPGPQTTAEEASLTFSSANDNAITVTDIESPRVLVALLGYYGTVTVQNTNDVEFPYPENNGTNSLVFYADSPADANAALESVVFTPDLNFAGTAHLSVLIQDLSVQSYYPVEDYADIPITVTNVNDPPLASDDFYELGEDQQLVVSDTGVLQNDFDIETTILTTGGNDDLTAVLVDGPAHGTVTLNSGGGFTYTPDANYFGTDSFTYRAADESLQSNVATVTLRIWSMDDPIEVAVPNSQTIAEDTSITFSAANGNAFTVSDIESPRVLINLMAQDGILTLASTEGLEFPYAESTNNSSQITFYADDPAEANAALEGLVFTPNANFNGQVYVSILAHDMISYYYPMDAFGYVQVTVAAVNDAPVAVNDSYAAEAGVPFWATWGGGGSGLGVLVNDHDVDMEMLSAVLVSGPAHGSLEFNSDGTFVYTADPTFSGTDSFTYRAFDGQLESQLATATFNVTLNLPPVSVGDAYALDEDSSLSVPSPGVVGNDTEPNGQPLTAQLVSGPAHGTLTLNANGSFTYTPTANYYGADEFWYRAFDGTYYSDPVAVNLTVNPINDAPVAADNTYSVDEDVVLTVSGTSVLGNDSDIDSVTLTAAVVTGPSHGVLSFNADGSFSYTPDTNYNGSDSFTYQANDGQASSNVATVSITVNAVNDAPQAVNDSYSLNEDQTLTIASIPGVTSLTMVSQPGDYIGQGQTYSYTTQTGTFTANRNFDNGVSVHYSDAGHWWHLHFTAPFNAELTPGYYANATRWPFQDSNVPGLSVYGDGRGSNTLTGNFTVTEAVFAANGDVLRFAAMFEQHNEGFEPALTGAINFNQGGGVSGVLLNDSDVEGSPLTIAVVTGPAHGTLSMNVDGSFSYQPAANYHGTDSFTYKLSDGTTESNIATVSLTVNSVNDFPTANHDAYTVAEDNVLAVGAPGVLANDSDTDGDSLTATLVTSPTHGSLTFNTDGSFTYTPQANYSGTDSFLYAARDGQSFSFIRTVTLNVTSVNDAPAALNDSYTTDEDSLLTVTGAGVLGNDSDVEGTALSAILVSGPSHGTLTLSSDGSFAYTPNADYHGSDSFTYQASDGDADSNVVTVSLTVNAVNDVPTATDDDYALDEDQSLTISTSGVLSNDTDVDGDVLSAVLVSGPSHGSLNLNEDGSFSYAPTANYHGSDSFTYKTNDGSLDSNVATVTVTIAPVNDAPFVDAGADQTVNEGSSVTFAGSASDADSDTLSYLWDFGDGSTATDAAATHVYADNGNYTVTVTVNDGQGGESTASLVVTVENVAPALSISGASSVNEADSYTLNLAASDPGQDTIANWTINWGDGNVQIVTGNPGSVSHAYADGTQTFTVSATATDEDGTYSAASQSVTVDNVAPTANIGGPAKGVRGQTLSFALGAVDPSATDQAGAFTFNINWGDGNQQLSTGSAGQEIDHVYAATGTYTVQVTATDKDGGVSTVAQHTIAIYAIDVQAGTLVIGGTTADDTITIAPSNSSGSLSVTINGANQGTFSSLGQIVVYGQAGNDQIKLNIKKIGPAIYYVTVAAVLFGDAGNDTLDARGSSANNILVGGAGTDSLQGGSGRDVLIGGAGADTLHGNGGDDLVIGNATDFDSNFDALNLLMAEWGRTDANYFMRISHLNGSASGGLNGGYLLNSSTVHDDAAVDQLYGEAGSDWFLYSPSGINWDRLNDLVAGEIATTI